MPTGGRWEVRASPTARRDDADGRTGIVIKGKCAESGTWAVFDKYKDVYTWYERGSYRPELMQTISMDDWHW